MTLMRRTSSYWPKNFNSFIDEFFNRDFYDSNMSNLSSTGTTVPAVNIVESNDEFQVEVAAPGMKKDDFHVELDNDMLIITSEKQDSSEHSDKSYARREFSYQSFNRTFHLPNTVEADKIKAKYENGVLRLVIPKKEEAKQKPVRQITIS